MKTTIAAALMGLATVALAAGQTRTANTFDVYVVDVEGGNATLFVAPLESRCFSDTGNGGVWQLHFSQLSGQDRSDCSVVRIVRSFGPFLGSKACDGQGV